MIQFNQIETPAVLVDEDIAVANIMAYQSYCNQHGLTLRPHIKTHKLPSFAQTQLKAGANGITCQKVSEASVMAEHGMNDILITYNILGEAKLAHLVRLASNVKRLAVVADNETVITALAKAFVKAPRVLDVLIECDTGAGRCGVQTPSETVPLAQQVTQSQGLAFKGLMTYPAVGGGANVQEFMVASRALLQDKNIDCEVISSGGSVDMWSAHTVPVVNEYRVGTYIYNDRSLVDGGICGTNNCALTVLSTVVSTPTPDRAVIDAGSKVLTTDLNGLEHYGILRAQPDLAVVALSEEHGILKSLGGNKTGLAIGDQVQIIPNHCCVVSNMVDEVTLHHGGERFETVEVAARGCIV